MLEPLMSSFLEALDAIDLSIIGYKTFICLGDF